MLARWLGPGAEALLRVVSPVRCAACDAPAEGDLCTACDVANGALVDTVSGFEVIAAAPYDSGVGRAVARLKYGARPDLARPLAKRLTAAVRKALLAPKPGDVLVVPVPLHPKKLAERGYNQSALVAGHLSAALGACFRPRALVRVRATPPQASLSRDERLGNLQGAIIAREPLDAAHVLLVDDVVTTGATACACGHALLAAGVARVTIAAVARADHSSISG